MRVRVAVQDASRHLRSLSPDSIVLLLSEGAQAVTHLLFGLFAARGGAKEMFGGQYRGRLRLLLWWNFLLDVPFHYTGKCFFFNF